MKLLLLGTSGYHPSDRRQTPCLLLPECGVMLDAGTATYRAADYLTLPDLDIFLSHAHLDHTIGLTFLLSLMRLHPLRRVTVHGQPEHLQAVRDHLFAEALFPVPPPFQMKPLGDTVVLPGDGRLTHFPLEHRGGSIGFRLDWVGHSMAYVTDTMADLQADYIARIRGVDLLIHECYFADAQAGWAEKTGHSHTTPVAEVARAAGVGQLVLTHVTPLSTAADPVGLDIARAIFPNTVLGEDRMELAF